jgi:hypothetical protein
MKEIFMVEGFLEERFKESSVLRLGFTLGQLWGMSPVLRKRQVCGLGAS